MKIKTINFPTTSLPLYIIEEDITPEDVMAVGDIPVNTDFVSTSPVQLEAGKLFTVMPSLKPVLNELIKKAQDQATISDFHLDMAKNILDGMAGTFTDVVKGTYTRIGFRQHIQPQVDALNAKVEAEHECLTEAAVIRMNVALERLVESLNNDTYNYTLDAMGGQLDDFPMSDAQQDEVSREAAKIKSVQAQIKALTEELHGLQHNQKILQQQTVTDVLCNSAGESDKADVHRFILEVQHDANEYDSGEVEFD